MGDRRCQQMGNKKSSQAHSSGPIPANTVTSPRQPAVPPASTSSDPKPTTPTATKVSAPSPQPKETPKPAPVRIEAVDPNKPDDMTFHLVIVGDKAVGKTSLLHRFTQDNFSDEVPPTEGVDFLV